jgi:hypothetical protein
MASGALSAYIGGRGRHFGVSGMWTQLVKTALAAGAFALLAGASASAEATPGAPAPAAPAKSCFARTQWYGWTASPEGDALFLRIGINDVYRVDLTPGTRARKWADSFLVDRAFGASAWVCSALDLNLEIADHAGSRQPLIAVALRKLTPAEVAAIPPRYRP